MADLRKAAEMALEALETYWMGENAGKNGFNAIQALRQALAMEKFSEVNQEIEEAIKAGTKAWADVPDATKWVDELRGEPEQERKWVGLTDEEIWEGLSLFNEYGDLNGFSFAQWAEAKLKEKNL
jgi:hypothetical protein